MIYRKDLAFRETVMVECVFLSQSKYIARVEQTGIQKFKIRNSSTYRHYRRCPILPPAVSKENILFDLFDRVEISFGLKMFQINSNPDTSTCKYTLCSCCFKYY